MARQNLTQPDTPTRWTLTPAMETAVDLLLSGHNVSEVARALDVARQTVSDWKNHHHGFMAALNARRQERYAAMTDKLVELVPAALAVLEEALTQTQFARLRLTAATQVLRAAGLYGLPAPSGPVDPEDLEVAEQACTQDRLFRALIAKTAG